MAPGEGFEPSQLQGVTGCLDALELKACALIHSAFGVFFTQPRLGARRRFTLL